MPTPRKKLAAAGLVPVLALALACATSAPPPPRSHVPAAAAPYFFDPVAGFPLAADAEKERQVAAGFAAIRSGGDLAAAAAAARELLAEDPGFHPARVLEAQVAFLDGDSQRVFELLAPVADELPGYLACQMLLGRAAELLEDLPTAFRAYRRVVANSSVARERVAELRSQVLDVAARRVGETLERGHVEEAAEGLLELEDWAAGELAVLELRYALEEARGDDAAQLEATRQLLAAVPDEIRYRKSYGDLLIRTGDVRGGLATLQQLAELDPGDAEVADKLAHAKFLRRLELLPAFVQELATKGELSRAELATLLYWLVPEVRYAQVESPPIATDILDHPRRDEILRVMNLGLIRLDETLHLFSPDAGGTRVEALRAMLGLLDLIGGELTCLRSEEVEALAASNRLTCRKSAQCGLIPEEADCLPRAVISGDESIELFRITLDLLAGR